MIFCAYGVVLCQKSCFNFWETLSLDIVAFSPLAIRDTLSSGVDALQLEP